MKKKITGSILILLPLLLFGQTIDNFDSEPYPGYWVHEISQAADSTLSYVNVSYVTDPVLEGTGAMQLDYSAHNIEAWGGYAKIYHMHPDTGEVWDWSGYDSISFSYYNSVAQTGTGSQTVHLRMNLSDYGDITDPSYIGLGEYYYSFHYILDNEPGWNTITMPLVRNDDWGGGGFNLTGWAGDAGNGELDKHAIAGFHFEFSIDGGGDGSYNYGTVVLDDMKLTGSLNTLVNPGFEELDESGNAVGWGAAHAGDGQAHANIVTDASQAHSGENYIHIGIDNGAAWAVFYTDIDQYTIPASVGETWRLSGYAKSVSGIDGDYGAFKIEGKDADGNLTGDSGDMYLPITDEWSQVTADFIMPAETVQATAVIVASRWDGSNCDYYFDDMFFQNVGALDIDPPAAVEDVSAVPANNYNLVTWTDVDGESGEIYNVYASTEPITDVSSPTVDVVATGVLEGSQAAVHYLYYPLEDTEVTYYYAVACQDASNNVGAPGTSSGSVTNMALGIPTISLDVPENFVADGVFDEWEGIEPFFLGVSDNSYGTPSVVNTVDTDDDLSGNVWLAVDDEYLYVAADVIDDVYDGYQPGDGTDGWWMNDVFELFIGLYDQRGAKHTGMQRGEEPDYKFYFLETGAINDFDNQAVLAENGDGNYFHAGYNPDWVVEAKLALDDIAFGDDILFNAVNGMRIPIEPTFHDNDGSGWEGNLVCSPFNEDNAYQTPTVWSSTWIGDSDIPYVVIDDDKNIIADKVILYPNYPNPFNPKTTIRFSLAEDQFVSLGIYNLRGQMVETLLNKTLSAGIHSFDWNAGKVASGIYLYQMQTKDKVLTRKMILMK